MIAKFFDQVFDAVSNTSDFERVALLVIVICVYHCVAGPHNVPLCRDPSIEARAPFAQ
jgi:hypothetical protein